MQDFCFFIKIAGKITEIQVVTFCSLTDKMLSNTDNQRFKLWKKLVKKNTNVHLMLF